MNLERKSFIEKQAVRMKATAQDPSSIDAVVGGEGVSEERIKALLERYETKILTYERRESSPSARRVLLEASQPANHAVVAPLMEDLIKDSACAGVTLLTDNVAGQRFTESGLPLHPVRTEGGLAFADIPSGCDVALVLDEPADTPAPALLWSAKSVFGVKRLYVLSVDLGGQMARQAFEKRDGKSKPDEVDGVLVADSLARELLCADGMVPTEKAMIVGSPMIEALPDDEKAAHLRISGREKLGISADAKVALFAGIVTADFATRGGASDLNRHAYEETVRGMSDAAVADAAVQHVLIIRTHPRARSVETLLIPTNLPENMKVVDGDGVTFDETLYAADISCCNPLSTEMLLGAYRGRAPVMFAYEGPGRFGEISESIFGKEGMEAIRKSGRAVFADSADAFSHIVREWQGRDPIARPERSSREMVKDILLHS